MSDLGLERFPLALMWVLGHVEEMDKLIDKSDVSGLIDMKEINLPGAPQ